MIGWVARLLLVIAGYIASYFVARDALHFDIVQMVVAMLLFTIFVFIIAFWPTVKGWIKRIIK